MFLSGLTTFSMWAVVQQQHVLTSSVCLTVHIDMCRWCLEIRANHIFGQDKRKAHWVFLFLSETKTRRDGHSHRCFLAVCIAECTHCQREKRMEKGAFDRQKCTQLWAGPNAWSINKLVSHGSFSTNHWLTWGFCFKLEFLCRSKHISHNNNNKWWVFIYCWLHWVSAFNWAPISKRCKKGIIKLPASAEWRHTGYV